MLRHQGLGEKRTLPGPERAPAILTRQCPTSHSAECQYPGLAVDEETQSTSRPQTGWRATTGRLATAFLTPRPRSTGPAANPPALSDPAKRKAILGLDSRERRVGYIGAALAGLIALVATVPYVVHPKTKVTIPTTAPKRCATGFIYQHAAKNCLGTYPRSHWVDELALLVALALALFIAVRVGRRAPVGFVALMAGLAFEGEAGFLLGIPFIAGGGWLLIRAWRVQRYGSPTATRANQTGETRPPPDRTDRATRTRTKSKAPSRTGPEPSKRYTPKTQKRKRPPPTPPESSGRSEAGRARPSDA